MTYGTLTLPVDTSSGPAAQPRHTHDCGHCRFIGHVDVHGGPQRDAYACPNGGSPELVLRHGSQCGDFSSLPQAVVASCGVGLPFHYHLASVLLHGLHSGKLG